jgi:hypothetical protein
MLHPQLRSFFDHYCCSCVDTRYTSYDDTAMIDDNSFNYCHPKKIGNSFYFYGKRKSSFPYHCIVGPDWIMVVMVYILIVAINGVILYVVSPLGWPPVLIGAVGALSLLWVYSVVVFSDPGTVYRNDYGSIVPATSYPPQLQTEQQQRQQQQEDQHLAGGDIEEQGEHHPLHTNNDLPAESHEHDLHGHTPASGFPVNPTSNVAIISAPTPAVATEPVFINGIRTMECGQCQFRRPLTARHCTYCKVCIDHLDHHCPW